MSHRPTRTIVLAAGKSLQLDGASKALIRHPTTGRTVLDYVVDAFRDTEITVVVGYRAIQIMQAYPELRYVHNPDWALTNNAMSLGLALDDRSTYVVSGDIFVGRELVERLDQAPADLALTSPREKRALSAIHCVVERGVVRETYQGPVRSMDHPESVGLFKVSSVELLREWRLRALRRTNLFAGQLLPCEHGEIASVSLESELFFEINTPSDYIELMDRERSQ